MSLPQRIPGPETIRLRDILSSSFSLDELDDFLLKHFNLIRGRITLGGSLDAVARDVVLHFDKRSRMPEFIAALSLERPNDDRVQGFRGALEDPLAPRHLERTIRAANSMLDVHLWTESLKRIQAQVCRIELRSSNGVLQFGTGFLVAKDVVVTNYHVIESVRGGRISPSAVVLRFDHLRLSEGSPPSPGREYFLAEDWLLDHSPYADADSDVHGLTVPRDDELDYAFLRVAGAPGDEQI